MAGTIAVTATMTVTNGAFSATLAERNASYVQDAIGMATGVVSIGYSAEEDIATGDISTLGWLWMKNLDDTNYFTYGPKSGTMVAFGRCEPGEIVLLRLEPGITITAQANTADVLADIRIFED